MEFQEHNFGTVAIDLLFIDYHFIAVNNKQKGNINMCDSDANDNDDEGSEYEQGDYDHGDYDEGMVGSDDWGKDTSH